MFLRIYNKQAFPLIVEQLKPLVEAVFQLEGCKVDEVCLHFVEEAEICRLHALYFDDPSPTDCISFPIDDKEEAGYRLLGEVFVCPKVAFDYTSAHDHDPYEEITLYVVHGLLHLLGYDDKSREEKREMRAAEKRHLTHLQKHHLLLGSPK